MEFVMAKTEHANLDIRVFDKSNPNGICVDMCDPWENKYRFIRHFARLEALWASWNVKICHSCSMLMKKNITLQRKVLR